MSERDLDVQWTAALADFDANDVPLSTAFEHLRPSLPHAKLLSLRRARTREAAAEARAILGRVASPWLREAFIARPLELAGHHAEALVERLILVRDVPRWEGELAVHVLTAVGRDALAVGRPDLAEQAARRALGFSPLEPMALALLAQALGASGRGEEAASVRAHLWDAGYGPDVIEGVPSDEDRAAAAWTPDLLRMEPMTLEDRARYAVYSLNDASRGQTVTAVVRHALVQLRCGHVAQARATLVSLRPWKPERSEVLLWLGLEGDSDRRDRMRTLLLDAVDATPAGAAAAAAARKKAPNPADTTIAGRRRGVAEAPAEAVEPALLDAYVGVRLDARHRLGDHPLVARAATLEASVDGVLPLYGAEPPGVWGQSLDLTGSWDPDALVEREPAERILPKLRALPVDDIVGFVPSHSFIERARAAKPACKACKQPFTIGEPQLLIRTEDDLLADAKPHHPRCAAKGKTKMALEAAAARWRHPLDLGG